MAQFFLNIRISQIRQKIVGSYFHYKSVIKNFFIYSFSSIIQRGIALFLAPVFLTLLDPTQFGILSLITSFNTILTAIMGFGLRQVYYLEYFHYSAEQRKEIINSFLLIYLALATPLALLLWLTIPAIKFYVFNNTVTSTILLLSITYCFLSFFLEFFYQQLNYQMRSWQLSFMQLSMALLVICLNLLFLTHTNLAIAGILLSYLITALVGCAIAFFFYYKNHYYKAINLSSARSKIKTYLFLGLPFIPSILFGWILSSGDKLMLAHYATLHDVGIYALADQASQLFYLLVLYPLSGSYLPQLFNNFAAHKENPLTVERHNRKIMILVMLGTTVCITLGFFAARPAAFLFLPAKYHQALHYVWLILMGNIFFMGTYFSCAFIQFHKKSYFLALALAIPALLNLILNALLIPHSGIMGCVVATVISYVCYFALTVWYNCTLQRKYLEKN